MGLQQATPLGSKLRLLEEEESEEGEPEEGWEDRDDGEEGDREEEDPLLGEPEEACKHLAQAIKLRPENRYHARNDSDFKPLETAEAKIKKGGGRFFNLSLVENPDILKSLSRFKPGKVYIGFSLESKGVFEHSLKKLRAKNLDLIVAQLVNEKVRPFGKTAIGAIIIDKRGGQKAFRSISKKDLAEYLVDKAEALRRSVCLYGNGQKR